MVNISILQPEDGPAGSPVILPCSLVALRSEDPASEAFVTALRRFLEDEKRKVLKKLRGLAAAEVADFLDEVCKPAATTTSSCGQLIFL